jgi:hypothetical protein
MEFIPSTSEKVDPPYFWRTKPCEPRALGHSPTEHPDGAPCSMAVTLTGDCFHWPCHCQQEKRRSPKLCQTQPPTTIPIHWIDTAYLRHISRVHLG